MLKNVSGKPLNLTCNEQAIPEFPEMLFGTSSEDGVTYFDATVYIQKKQSSLNVKDFFRDYKPQIESLCNAYQTIDRDNICKLNTKGHLLIDSTFLYLFISFVEPDFLAYMCEQINDLFISGICISDTQIVRLSKKLPKDILRRIIEDE
jgi:hypothetical protein